MVADGTCGIDLEIIRAPGVAHYLPEYNLRSRGATDVSEADKQNAVWWLHVREIGGH